MWMSLKLFVTKTQPHCDRCVCVCVCFLLGARLFGHVPLMLTRRKNLSIVNMEVGICSFVL